MLSEQTRERETQLKNLLRELSNEAIDEEKCEAITSRFAAIYEGGFRHRYSVFHPLLQEIIASSDAEQGVSEFLTVNLNTISKYIENRYINDGQGEHSKIYRPIFKLCDHINLELTRINEQRNQENRLCQLYVQIEQAQHNLELARTDAEEARKQVNKAQTDILAILSTFSAVILAFMGGTTFLSGAMSSISETRIYKFVIACCVCGLIIFNTIFLLLYIVSKIIEKPIYARCESPDCTCDNGRPQCCALNRVRKRLPYVFYFNVCILALLISTVIIRYAAPTVKEWAHNHEVSSLSGAGDSLGNDVGDEYDANPEHAQATQ